MNLEQRIKEEAKILWHNLQASNEVPYWFECRKQLLQLIINTDLKKFLNWKLLRDTMYVINTDYSNREYTEIIKSDSYVQWAWCLVENDIGDPTYASYSPGTSDNLVHTIYHLSEYEKSTKTSIKDNKTILEFGGGYGCMASVIKKLNACEKYIIYDFPEFNLLQKYYLLANGIPVCTNISEFIQNGGVYLTNSINELKMIQSYDLLIATWSLSETSIEFRTQFLNSIKCNNYLLAYQKQFDDANSFLNVNNNDFFSQMTNNTDYVWDNHKIQHLFGEQYYLFGAKK